MASPQHLQSKSSSLCSGKARLGYSQPLAERLGLVSDVGFGPPAQCETHPLVDDVEPMTVDSSMAAPTVQDLALKNVDKLLKILLRNGDGAFTCDCDEDLGVIYLSVYRNHPNFTGLVSRAQFQKSARTKSASAFFNLLEEALKGNDISLWVPVVTHGASPPTMDPVLTAHSRILDISHKVPHSPESVTCDSWDGISWPGPVPRITG